MLQAIRVGRPRSLVLLQTAVSFCLALPSTLASPTPAFVPPLPANHSGASMPFTCGTTTSSTFAMATDPTALAGLHTAPLDVQAMKQLLHRVYGDPTKLLNQGLFPRPLPANEAGPSMVPYGDTDECQRHYLWIDAWGVLCLTTLAMRCGPGEEHRVERDRYLRAAGVLVDSVHATLGQPRGPEFPMRRAATPEEAARTPHGYIGLRIGKEQALPGNRSDAGMHYDGVYFHYVDKWAFALLRLSQACEAFVGEGQGERYLLYAENLIKTIHPLFVAHDEAGKPLGVYWKLSYDMSVIKGLEGVYPNDDALSGWVVYSLVRHERERRGHPSPIAREQEELGQLARAYVQEGKGIHVSRDSLGWGLQAWKSQWLGPWAEAFRARLQLMAGSLRNGPLHVEKGMRLPFRLYGAIQGARLLTGGSPPGGRGMDAKTQAERALAAVTELELADEESDFGSINKVMLAAALDPLALARLETEPLLDLPEEREK